MGALLLLMILVVIVPVSSQTYSDDSLAVRAILDANGLNGVSVESVTTVRQGRITRLTIYAQGLVLPAPSVQSLTALSYLNVTGCGLSTLPVELKMFERLQTLTVSANPLETLPPWINELDSLRELNATRCELRLLPEEIGSFPSLRMLRLGQNRLTSLPPSIGLQSRLTHLFLEGNQLKTLPESIGDASSLVYIDLSNNGLEQFPVYLTTIKTLHILYLDSNALTAIPDDIGNLDLLTFSLNSNELAQLPGSIRKLSGLFFFIDDNRLCSLPDSIQAWLDEVAWDLWDWRTTQRCPQSAVTPPAMAPAADRALSVVRQEAGNLGRIEYQVSTPGSVRIQVWNPAGALIWQPINGFHVPGTHTVSLSGTRLARGTYMIRMVSDSRQILRPVVVGR